MHTYTHAYIHMYINICTDTNIFTNMWVGYEAIYYVLTPYNQLIISSLPGKTQIQIRTCLYQVCSTWHKWDPLMTRSRGRIEDFPHVFLLTLASLFSNICSATLNLLQCLKYATLSLIWFAHVLLLLMSSATFLPSSHTHYVIDNTDPHTFCQINFYINSKEAFKGDLLYFRKIPLTILFLTAYFQHFNNS